MHGLIFETSICYWQDQPGSLWISSCAVAGRVAPPRHRRWKRRACAVAHNNSATRPGARFLGFVGRCVLVCERAFVVKTKRERKEFRRRASTVTRSRDDSHDTVEQRLERFVRPDIGLEIVFFCVCCSRSSAWGSSVSEKPRTEAGRIRNKRGTDRSKRHARPGAPASGDDGEEGKVE